MFTPDSLLKMSVDYTRQADEISASMGDTRGYNEHLWQLRRKAREALVCAEWMENNGVSETPMIGPFGNIRVEKGAKVRIKAGAIVNGFGPEFVNGQKTIQRAYTVYIKSVDAGYALSRSDTGNIKDEVCNQRVDWSGTGGYWRWTDTTNIEICP